MSPERKSPAVFYETVLSSLEKHQVCYAVVGGVAVTLHGVVRFTADLDLVVDLSEGNLRKFLEAMKEAGYVPRLPVPPEDLLSFENRKQWMTEKNLVVFTFLKKDKPLEDVDVLLGPSGDPGIFQRSKRSKVGRFSVTFAGVDDLITMKSGTGRQKDEADIEDLKRLKKIQDEETR